MPWTHHRGFGQTLCTGDLVIINGEALHIPNVVGPVPESGLFLHFEDLFRLSGTGVDESGNEYVFSEVNHDVNEGTSLTEPPFTFMGRIFRMV